jgi:hypothetical protein
MYIVTFIFDLYPKFGKMFLWMIVILAKSNFVLEVLVSYSIKY